MKNEIEWHLEKRKISELKPYFKNPRILTKDQEAHLRKSLEKFGLIDRPFINLDNTIIGGHQRLSILGQNKTTEIEVWVPSRALDDKEVEELNIRHNRNLGEWNWDILANEFEISELIDWGFTEQELEFDSISMIEPQEEEETSIEPPKDPISQKGDIFELNKHRLMCGDSTLPDDVLNLLNTEEPNLMVTDPPYGVEYDPAWRKTLKEKKGKNLAVGKVTSDNIADWSVAWALFPGNVAYIWHAARFASIVEKSLVDNDFEIKSQIIWQKQNFALSRGDYHWKHEPCWYAVRKGQKHNWKGGRDQSTVWEIANLGSFGKNQEDERTAHSTQKPIECMAIPIKNNSSPGDIIYDPFLGSGTTLIAAENLKRICYGLEIDPAYCDIVIMRWINHSKKNGTPFVIKRNGIEIDWETLQRNKLEES